MAQLSTKDAEDPPKGDNTRYLHSGVGLANSTMQQRLTVVRLLYDYLIDEHIRLDQHNPIGKGKFTPDRAFAGKRERGILRHYEQLSGYQAAMSGIAFLMHWYWSRCETSFEKLNPGKTPGTAVLV